jgi:hypothetical protein
MTPKEKAKEIYCKYADALNIRDLQTNANPFVKQCALIAVDEILNNFGLISESYIFYTSSSTRSFYEEVKQEIEKL